MSAAGLVSVREESLTFLPPLSTEHGPDAIWLFVNTPEIPPMQVLKSDSIESVKLRIRGCKGFLRRSPKLVCSGRELARSNSLVRDYDLCDGNVLHFILRQPDVLEVKVTTCSGKEFSFNEQRGRSVGYVREKLELVEDHEVLLNGQLIDDNKLITDLCSNNTDAAIHLFVRKTAKIRASPVGKNFELSIVAAQQNDVRKCDVEREMGRRDDLESKPDVFVPRKPPGRETVLEPVIVNPKIELPPEISNLINATRKGLDQGHYPIRSLEGTGGAYFMLDSSGTKYLSVFKPTDEEPLAVNNPRGLPLSEDGQGLKKGTSVGGGALRECAAFLLDHPRSGRRFLSGEVRGFAGVPPTVYVNCLHEGFNHPGGVSVKTGSLQMFVENNGSCEDIGPGAFPIDEVHKIAVLDMRMANADRHTGNILVSKDEDGRTVLIPIDHGYCLPYKFEDCTFDWLYWPQARQPFSPDTLEYIRSMDAEKDIALLKFYGWELPDACARVLRISTMLLKKGSEKGLTPYVIGNMMCRETVWKKSVVEGMVEEADASVLPESSEAGYLDAVSSIMDRRLEEFS